MSRPTRRPDTEAGTGDRLTPQMMTPLRIDGWKAIGRFVGREVRTAQRWTHARGLPVRHVAGSDGSVFAWAHELRAWLDRASTPIGLEHEPAPVPRAPGLLVLPFEYHAPGTMSNAMVGDTLAQELLHRLAVTPPSKVRVLSWTTSRSYQAAAKRADEIAMASGVRYLVEGVVQEIGPRWCIDIRLIDAVGDRIEFADRFVADGPDILSLQSTIAQAVAGQLGLHIGGQLLEPFWDEPVSPPAFLAYVGAARAATRPNTQHLRAALAQAEEACTLDPSFIPARTLVASLQLQLGRIAGVSPQRATAHAFARDCIRAAPQLATSKALDALLATTVDNDWTRADRRYAEITTALPANLSARWSSAITLSLRGRFDAAQAALDEAAAIDDAPQVMQARAYLHIWKGEYETAAKIQDAILAHPDFQFPTTVMQAMVVGLMLRDQARMNTLFDSIEPEMPLVYRSFLEACRAATMDDGAALASAHRRLTTAAVAGEALWYHVALLDGYVGNAAGAAEHLGYAIDRYENGTQNAAVAPCFQRVRDDPRFRTQLRRLNLCPPQRSTLSGLAEAKAMMVPM
jgi:TolB-like protein